MCGRRRGRSERVADGVDAVGRAKFPFWTCILRYVVMFLASVVYWGVISVVILVGVSWVVGFGESWESVVSFVSGVEWVFGFVGSSGVLDSVVLVGLVVYPLFVLQYLTKLSVERPTYSSSGRREWVMLGVYSGVSVFLGLFVVSGLHRGSMSPYSLVWFAGSSYFVARSLSNTVREDNELEDWFGSEFPWKVSVWMAFGYMMYVLVEGGVDMFPEVVDVAVLFVPTLVGVVYLVRRYLGVHGVWVSGSMSSRVQQQLLAGEFEEVEDEEDEESNGEYKFGVDEFESGSSGVDMSFSPMDEEEVEDEESDEDGGDDEWRFEV